MESKQKGKNNIKIKAKNRLTARNAFHMGILTIWVFIFQDPTVTPRFHREVKSS